MNPLPMDVLSLVKLALSLGGFGALIAGLVNILKTFGVVKDGWAKTWVTGGNLLLLIALYVSGLIGFDLAAYDGLAKQFYEIGMAVVALIVQLRGSSVMHGQVRGVPLIGKSFGLEREE